MRKAHAELSGYGVARRVPQLQRHVMHSGMLGGYLHRAGHNLHAATAVEYAAQHYGSITNWRLR
eukprot:CAMPEP_0198586372 /NCGR_PEP_ID=MMETSP1462-20131121/130511_1 /TAXON_ID=1333877 /ORGANISM="Brandtodinium nutriculum, Strain RCC3387" /LENGTH=63 /DNA_ID=CAMNT_0044317825 /DNA_START=143 /DNA_END=330 /DNA_ORIENTATION=-